VIGEDGKLNSFGIKETTRFSLGYNDWGLRQEQRVGGVVTVPGLGMGGDVGSDPVKDTKIRNPSEMIAIGDVRSDATSFDFNANVDPRVSAMENSAQHNQCPCNRHNYRTDILFADGHVEGVKRNDVIDPNNAIWRARWNNDNDPHTEISWTVPWLPNSGPLEQ
jgi:prepilin-type processing-associated H-X9-DG protein